MRYPSNPLDWHGWTTPPEVPARLAYCDPIYGVIVTWGALMDDWVYEVPLLYHVKLSMRKEHLSHLCGIEEPDKHKQERVALVRRHRGVTILNVLSTRDFLVGITVELRGRPVIVG